MAKDDKFMFRFALEMALTDRIVVKCAKSRAIQVKSVRQERWADELLTSVNTKLEHILDHGRAYARETQLYRSPL